MDSKIVMFEKFAQQAAKRLEERKKRRTETLKVKGADGMEDLVLEIRGLSDTEMNECFEFSNDSIEVDRYTIYCASKTLQEAAKIMAASGQLQPGKEYKITEMFTAAQRNFIARRVLTLSGALGDAGVEIIKETDEIKNS
ncbi:MAG: hypothetical protein NC389_09845 [Acetatifactor muris]|nr:hypothetical protein [Acetatifactor muris]